MLESNKEELYEKLFEVSEDPLWLMSEDSHIEVNDAAVKMLGYNSKEELGGLHPAKFSPKYQEGGILTEDHAVAMMQKADDDGYNKFEWLHQKKDGTVFPVEVSLTRTMVDNKKAYIVVWRDITQRKQYEKELEEAKEKALLASKKIKEQSEIMFAQLRLNDIK